MIHICTAKDIDPHGYMEEELEEWRMTHPPQPTLRCSVCGESVGVTREKGCPYRNAPDHQDVEIELIEGSH